MTANRLLGALLNWPRVSAAWRDLTQRRACISVTHTVHATIFRAPVEQVKNHKTRGDYYDCKRIYVPGIISRTVYSVPEADDKDAAKAMVAEQLGMKPRWSELILEPKELRDSVTALPGDVVEYREELN